MLLLLGCPHADQLCVSASDLSVSGLAFTLAQGRSCSEVPRVTSVEVYKTQDFPSRWAIVAREPTPITSLRYGTVPPGFEQSLTPSALLPGDKVTIQVHGPGLTGGLSVTLK